jgi:hypothetical protein
MTVQVGVNRAIKMRHVEVRLVGSGVQYNYVGK